MRIAVVGAGYVGLVTAAGFADFGDNVTCVDVDEKKIDRLKRGDIPIFEPGLAELVKKNIEEGTLFFTTDVAFAVRGADVIFICVGTPQGEDGSADLNYVLTAAEQIGRRLRGWAVIVDKSTVPVGTAEKVKAVIAAVTDIPFAVASNPEFLKEGDAITDFMKPDRIVIGVDDERAKSVLEKLYAPFTKTTGRLLVMDVRSAELTKYAANSMLATRVSFMNQIANLCEKVGADVDKVRMGVGLDSRIGPRFLYAGVGWGGSCFGKDVKALRATARDVGMDMEILNAVEHVNELQKSLFVDKITAHFGGDLKGKKIGIWGLAFKPGTDDIRDAPSFAIIERLYNEGALLHAYDPIVKQYWARSSGPWYTTENAYDAVKGADTLVLITEWHEFRSPNWSRVKELMPGRVVFDGRNIWDPSTMRALGFTYYGVGR